MATFILPDQPQFRGRNDDGSESAATWIAALNTNWSQNVDSNFRVRLTTQALAGTGANSPIAMQLWYSLNGGAYTQVTSSSSVVRLFTSGNVSDSAATTQQISGSISASFAAGQVLTSTSTSSSVNLTAAGTNVTEHEWCVQIVGADVSNGDTIELRTRTGAGGAFPGYTQTPSITVVKSAPSNNVKGFFVYL